MDLQAFGWNSEWEEKVQTYGDGFSAGRVAAAFRDRCLLWTEQGETWAHWPRRGLPEGSGPSRPPVAGDWVVWDSHRCDGILLAGLLPHRSKLSRKAAGKTHHEHILAANVDRVFIASSLNNEFNPNRLERYLAMVWQGNALPAILLTKADACPDVTPYLEEAAAAAPGVDIHVISTVHRAGLSDLNELLGKGVTAALVGSSGVGKSTLVNALLGEEAQKTRNIREGDQRGRHATTHRELFILPTGALLLDTPGLRELQPWGEPPILNQVFSEIEALAPACRFRDCHHQNEPGCAVRQALEDGRLEERRYRNFLKLQKELQFQQRQQSPMAKHEERRREKNFTKLLYRHLKNKGRK